jgi:hypothetical protein
MSAVRAAFGRRADGGLAPEQLAVVHILGRELRLLDQLCASGDADRTGGILRLNPVGFASAHAGDAVDDRGRPKRVFLVPLLIVGGGDQRRTLVLAGLGPAVEAGVDRPDRMVKLVVVHDTDGVGLVARHHLDVERVRLGRSRLDLRDLDGLVDRLGGVSLSRGDRVGGGRSRLGRAATDESRGTERHNGNKRPTTHSATPW